MGLVVLKKKGSGFTLIEVMIALTVLLIGMLGIAAMLVTSIDANENNKRSTEATYLAEQQMELFRGEPYSQVVNMNAADLANNTCINALGNNTSAYPPRLYKRIWSVMNNSTSLNSPKTVAVTVNWKYKNQPHSVSLATVKAD